MLAVMKIERLGRHEVAKRVLGERQVGKREGHGVLLRGLEATRAGSTDTGAPAFAALAWLTTRKRVNSAAARPVRRERLAADNRR